MRSEAGFVVLIVVLSVAYLLTFGIAACRAARGDGDGRAFAVGVGGLALLGGLVLALVAWFVHGLRCDESCNENLVPSARLPGWQHWNDSWQWDVQWALALLVLAATLAATVLVGMHKERLSIVAAAVAGACAIGWAALILT